MKKPTPPEAPKGRHVGEDYKTLTQMLCDLFKPTRQKKESLSMSGLPVLTSPVPRKRHFTAMSKLISDAEKYDNAGEKELSKKVLSVLSEYITDHIKK